MMGSSNGHLREKNSPNWVYIVCPRCSSLLKELSPFEGKRVKCPHCGFAGVLKFFEGVGFELIPEDNVWILG